MNFKVELESLKKMASLPFIEKMSGVLSDSDIKILASALGTLSEDVGEDKLYSDLIKIKGTLERIKKDVEEYMSTGVKKYENDPETEELDDAWSGFSIVE